MIIFFSIHINYLILEQLFFFVLRSFYFSNSTLIYSFGLIHNIFTFFSINTFLDFYYDISQKTNDKTKDKKDRMIFQWIKKNLNSPNLSSSHSRF